MQTNKQKRFRKTIGPTRRKYHGLQKRGDKGVVVAVLKRKEKLERRD